MLVFSSSLMSDAKRLTSMGMCWTTACSAQGLCRGALTPARCVGFWMWRKLFWHRPYTCKIHLSYQLVHSTGRLRWTLGVWEKWHTLCHRCGELGRWVWSKEQAWCVRQRPRVYQLDQKQDQLNWISWTRSVITVVFYFISFGKEEQTTAYLALKKTVYFISGKTKHLLPGLLWVKMGTNTNSQSWTCQTKCRSYNFSGLILLFHWA